MPTSPGGLAAHINNQDGYTAQHNGQNVTVTHSGKTATAGLRGALYMFTVRGQLVGDSVPENRTASEIFDALKNAAGL